MNDNIALCYTKFNQLLTFHLQSVLFPRRKMVFSDDERMTMLKKVGRHTVYVRNTRQKSGIKDLFEDRLINQFKGNDTMKRRPGSGRPRSAITPADKDPTNEQRNKKETSGKSWSIGRKVFQ